MYISVPSHDIDYKVMVRCATYNHSKYIQETLNGFAIQNTDFPFICIVVDDASTDGNQEVIRQYANENCNMSNAEISEDDISKYIRVSHKTNANCSFLFCLLKVNLYGKPEKKEIYKPYRAICKYEAVCEGDDYWIDGQKLYDQYHFLEENKDYGLVHTYYDTVDEYNNLVVLEEDLYSNMSNRIKDGYVWHYYLTHSGFILTCTAMVRLSCRIGEKTFVDHGFYMEILRNSKVYCIRRKTAAYRYINTGAMRSNGSGVQQAVRNASFMQLYYFYKNRYHTNKFYCFNPIVFFHIEYFFTKYLIHLRQITIPNKVNILMKIIIYNPFLFLFSPFALIIGCINTIIHKINRYES